MLRKIVTLLLFVTLLHALPQGVPVSFQNSYILGGENARIEDYPFMCTLNSFSSFTCGCTILNRKWIMTAAHCSGDSISYGVSDRTSSEAKTMGIKKCIRHPDYVSFFHDDLMLCELTDNLVFNEKVQPVRLPPSGFKVPGSWESTATALGWGYNSQSILPIELQKVDFLVVSSDECQRIHQGVGEVTYKHICGGVKGGGKGECNGDSGGPMIYQGMQVGVVSWSIKPCTRPEYPGVYTNVTNYVSWIKETSALLY